MAIKADELMSMVESLPIEIKTKLIEKILHSLHPTQKEIDELWAQEVEKRFNDIRTGKVKPVTADEVFGEIQKIYNK